MWSHIVLNVKFKSGRHTSYRIKDVVKGLVLVDLSKILRPVVNGFICSNVLQPNSVSIL